MKKYLGIFVLAILVAGCGGQKEKGAQKLRIVCTTGMLADALSHLSDSTCEVVALMGPGTDPHLFKPSKASLDLLAEADVVVANGLHLEGKMADILTKLALTRKVVFAGDFIEADRLIYGDEGGNIPDPHLWFDVALWRDALIGVGSQLSDMPGYNVAEWNAYLANLDSLDAWARAEMRTIPEEGRVLVTAHDAFSYFGRAYNTDVVGLQGISTVSEYGLNDVARVIKLVEDRGVKAIFAESSVSSRSVEAVVAGCEERGLSVALGGTLYSDAMGPAGSGADTYRGMVMSNVKTIKEALD